MGRRSRNIMVYSIGTVILGVAGLVNTMLLTRMLSSKVYALYGLVSTFVMAASTLISFGYDASYARFFYSNGFSSRRFLLECLKMPLVIFAVFCIAVLDPKQELVHVVFQESFSLYCVVALLMYILFSVLHRFTQLTARMEEHAWKYVISNIVAKTGFLLLVYAIFYVCGEVSFYFLLVSFVVTSALAVCISLSKKMFVSEMVKEKKQCVTQRMLIAYGGPIVVNNAMVLIIPLIEKMLVRDIAGWEVLSIYTAGAVFQTVISMLTSMVENIWNPIVYKNYENIEWFKPVLHKWGLALTAVMCVGCALCILLRRYLVLVFDRSYFDVMVIAPTIMFASSLSLISCIYGVGINISKKTVHLVISPIFQLVLTVVLCNKTIPLLGLRGVGISLITSIGVSRIYRMVVGLKYYSTGHRENKSFLLMGIGMGAAIFSMFKTSLVTDCCICAFVILATVLIINSELKDILGCMKRRTRYS